MIKTNILKKIIKEEVSKYLKEDELFQNKFNNIAKYVCETFNDYNFYDAETESEYNFKTNLIGISHITKNSFTIQLQMEDDDYFLSDYFGNYYNERIEDLKEAVKFDIEEEFGITCDVSFDSKENSKNDSKLNIIVYIKNIKEK